MSEPDRRARAEEIRRRHAARRRVLRGQASLPRAAAVGLVGPDCAYHLYARHAPAPSGPQAPPAVERTV